MSIPDPEAPSILHNKSERASWSRANEKGVFPGVSSPLNWSIWGEIGERAVRRGAFDLGLLDEHELALPASVDDWGWSIFYGRPTANVDTWRALYERGLGGEGQGAATQQQVFGGAASSSASASATASTSASPSTTPPGSRSSTARDRRAILAAKRPVALATSPARLAATRREAIQWWGEATREIASGGVEAAERRFREALALFERADRDHIVVSLLSTEAVTTLSGAAAAAGRPEAANALMVGYPGMEEFETAVAVWDLSRGRITLAEFLAEHGFHGSMEGEIASRSWREDPGPVRALAERYAKLPESDDPRRREARAVEQRERLEAELRAAVAPAERPGLDRAFELAATCLPMREAGRATLTIALDAMRAAARRIGDALARSGQLDAAEDVFLLTRFDLLGEGEGEGGRASEGDGGGDGTGEGRAGHRYRGGAGAAASSSLRARAELHRALVRAYEAFDLPETWQGMPPKQPRTSRAEAVRAQVALAVGERLEGLGASAGVHEGIARVVLDPADPALEFEAGDVLVAPATDPSWAPLFLVAGAVVIDTGSNISHAAVVAREMGIPAVVAARDASLRLRSGQRLRVDGRAGIVEIV
ncbi:MAG: PEP-utilizing enzyme [Myxococcota bacterium]